MGFVAALLMAGCADDELMTATDSGSQQTTLDDPTGQPVLFSVGNLNLGNTTRADAIPYMTQGGCFVCTMYYHPGSEDTDSTAFDIKHPSNGGTMKTAWLQVNDNYGNSVYRKNTFATPTKKDPYDFDTEATNFYWQNRLQHVFLALTDYNKLTTIDGDTTTVKIGKLKMYPYYDKDMVPLPLEEDEGTEEEIAASVAAYDNTLADARYYNAFDLTRKEGMDTIAKQPDPILALTIMKPSGSSQEANRVRLYFKHQFSQIQVNLRASDDTSAEITSEQIDSVELLGVSDTAYVCCRINADKRGSVGAAKFKDVNLDKYTDAQLDDNPWGSSFEMFDMGAGNYADGYLKSFNAIAFGYLWAIRIRWHEGTTESPGVRHVATYEVPQYSGEASGNIPLRQLKSGMKYIYNLELRRGTLAVIRTEIVDWKQEEALVYGEKGTISN